MPETPAGSTTEAVDSRRDEDTRSSRRGVRGRRRRRFLRGAAITIATVAFLALAGLTTQTWLESVDRANNPAPGQMVAVAGDRRLHVNVLEGPAGSPTVVLETGGTLTSAAWAWLQPALAEYATVVAYDRANTGWSDPGPGGGGASPVVTDLHALLDQLSLPGPYVLVGHSVGGHYVQEYAKTHPSAVDGLILLDPSPSGWSESLPPEMVDAVAGQQSSTGLLRVATALGLTRLINPFAGIADGLPEPERSAQLAATTDSRHIAGIERDAKEFMRIGYEELRYDFGGTPLMIISAGVKTDAAHAHWQAAQWDAHHQMLSRSTDATHEFLPEATHTSLLTDAAHASRAAELIAAQLRRTSGSESSRGE